MVMKKRDPSPTLLIAARAREGRRTEKFWANLEKYVYGRAGRLRGKWQWGGVGIAMGVIGVSVVSGYFNSPTLSADVETIIREAAKSGDYTLAQELYRENYESRIKNNVLGLQSDLDELVYPERKLEREIAEWEEKLARYPTHRDMLLALAELELAAGNVETARQYWEEARKLDPNGKEVSEAAEKLF